MPPNSTPKYTVDEKFKKFRAGFPALKNKTYLSVCDKMILHDEVRQGVDSFLDHLAGATANRVQYEEKVISSRSKFAAMMNVKSATVAAVRNVSDGINSIAWAMPFKNGDNVIICVDAEHPNNVYPWLRLQNRGIEIRYVKSTNTGEINVPEMISAINAQTKIVSCASVSFAPGHRTDLARLGESCTKNDVLLLIDGVQSAGVLAHDFENENIDAFATSTSKGLLGLYGYGFLYVAPKWIDRLEPAYLSRSAVQMESNDHSAMGEHLYRLQPDSRRFEVGSYNLAGAYAADVSVDLLLELGISDIEAHVLALAGTLNDGISSLGVKPGVPNKGPRQSHIVTFGELDAGGHGFSTDHTIRAISEVLNEANVAHTIRRGQLRFALHAYNNEADIYRTISCVLDAVRAQKNSTRTDF